MESKKQYYQVVKDCGILYSRENKKTGETTDVRLTRTGWYGKASKWELRNWIGTYAGSGVVIGNDAALKKLRDMLIDICKQIDEDDDDED